MRKLLKYVELNLTELCNFNCPFCPRGHGYPNQNLHMSLDTLDLILDSIRDLDQEITVQLAGRGEPTLHKEFGKILERLLEFREEVPSFRIEMNTNGARVPRYKHLMDKIDRVTYNIYPESRIEYQDAVDTFPDYLVKDKKKPDERKWKTRAGYIPLTEINPQSFEPQPRYGKMCHKPFEVVYINYNGDYNLCCDVWKDIETLGNVKSEPISQYYDSNKRLLEYRKHLLKGERTIDPCKDCNIRCSYEFIQRFEEVLSDRKGSH